MIANACCSLRARYQSNLIIIRQTDTNERMDRQTERKQRLTGASLFIILGTIGQGATNVVSGRHAHSVCSRLTQNH